jgi:Flp pilus assembly pilin Flp
MPLAGGTTASDSFIWIVAGRLIRSERGASAVEYALLAGIIAIGISGGLTLTRQSLRTQYDCVATRLDSAGAQVCASGSPSGGQGLTGEAARAQSLLPPGAQILANGLFYDIGGGTAYAAALAQDGSSGVQPVTLSNTATGQTAAIDAAVVSAGVYELSLSVLGAIGPGAADLGVGPGMVNVVYVIPGSDGAPRLYYGTRPA